MADASHQQRVASDNTCCGAQACLSPHARPETSRVPERKLRVLVADDQQIACEVLKRLLRHEQDVEVVGTSASGPETLEKIAVLKPDLVFLDVHMPGMDGFEVLEKLPAGESPMVVFVTANEVHAGRARKIQADFVLKPCTRDLVRTALRRAMARRTSPEPGEDF